jgi:hypothetical protein
MSGNLPYREASTLGRPSLVNMVRRNAYTTKSRRMAAVVET